MRSLGTFEELIINLNPQYKTNGKPITQSHY